MLKYRLVSGSCLVAVLLGSIFLKGVAGAALFTLFSVVLMGVGISEFYTMFSKLGVKPYAKWGIAAALGLLTTILVPAFMGLTVDASLLETAVFASLVIFGFFRVLREEDIKAGIQSHIVTLGGFVYIGWMLSFIPKIYFLNGYEDMNMRYLLMFLILVTKISDVGAYAVGMTCSKVLSGGTHKIAPKLSPGKSWEGFVGGIVFSIALAFVFRHFCGESLRINADVELITPIVAVVCGIVAGSLGFIGDVSESVLKRSSGMKDSGKVLPGMGGVLDVLDSLVFVSPLFYLYIKFAG